MTEPGVYTGMGREASYLLHRAPPAHHLGQEHVFEATIEPPQIKQPYTTQEKIAMGVGLGALSIGIPVAGLLAYKVMRKIGENIFAQEDKEEKKNLNKYEIIKYK